MSEEPLCTCWFFVKKLIILSPCLFYYFFFADICDCLVERFPEKQRFLKSKETVDNVFNWLEHADFSPNFFVRKISRLSSSTRKERNYCRTRIRYPNRLIMIEKEFGLSGVVWNYLKVLFWLGLNTSDYRQFQLWKMLIFQRNLKSLLDNCLWCKKAARLYSFKMAILVLQW